MKVSHEARREHVMHAETVITFEWNERVRSCTITRWHAELMCVLVLIFFTLLAAFVAAGLTVLIPLSEVLRLATGRLFDE